MSPEPPRQEHDRKKMNRALILCMLASACATGCATGSDLEPDFVRMKAQAKTICRIMASPRAYLGQRVIVRASYFHTPHGTLLFDDHCKKWTFSVNDRHWVASEEPRQKMRVIYSGVFTSETIMLHCADPTCFRYSIEDARLLASSPAPR